MSFKHLSVAKDILTPLSNNYFPNLYFFWKPCIKSMDVIRCLLVSGFGVTELNGCLNTGLSIPKLSMDIFVHTSFSLYLLFSIIMWHNIIIKFIRRIIKQQEINFIHLVQPIQCGSVYNGIFQSISQK